MPDFLWSPNHNSEIIKSFTDMHPTLLGLKVSISPKFPLYPNCKFPENSGINPFNFKCHEKCIHLNRAVIGTLHSKVCWWRYIITLSEAVSSPMTNDNKPDFQSRTWQNWVVSSNILACSLLCPWKDACPVCRWNEAQGRSNFSGSQCCRNFLIMMGICTSTWILEFPCNAVEFQLGLTTALWLHSYAGSAMGKIGVLTINFSVGAVQCCE